MLQCEADLRDGKEQNFIDGVRYCLVLLDVNRTYNKI